MLFGAWVTRYEYSVPAYAWLFASCSIAVLVNLSQFMCLGRFSAVSFQVCIMWCSMPHDNKHQQVLGHAKTFLVLLGGWMIFREAITSQQFVGMAIAVAGMVWYGAESSKPSVTAQAVTPTTTTGKRGEFAEPLLRGSLEGEDGERKETV